MASSVWSSVVANNEGTNTLSMSVDTAFITMRKVVARLGYLHRQFIQPRGFVSMKMSDLNINSKYEMLSGYEIPILGYGVSKYFYICSLVKPSLED